jgi:MinD-like ATPase involved in chromosome partitioning or flagellar assembly
MEDIPENIRTDIRELSEDELDFIERDIFLAFDEAYEDYHIRGIDTKAEIIMYERAMETIRAVRNIKESLSEKQIKQAKEIHSLIDDK